MRAYRTSSVTIKRLVAALSTTARQPPHERVHMNERKTTRSIRWTVARGARDNDGALARKYTSAHDANDAIDHRRPSKLRSDSSRYKKTTRRARMRFGVSPLFALANGRLTSCATNKTTYKTRQLARQQPDRVRDTIKKKSTFFDLCRGTSTNKTTSPHNIEHARSSPLQFSQYTREQNHNDAQRQHRQLVRRRNSQRC